ncbi:sugar ABC transporter ATP-binding protein [Alkalispirochaeta alkalica]|uniref:sugar ABC transporter ATP-binding protein n=1 Tax=Alkalispirochaeta alkalica TaxID=46356 RepID=UPI000372054E|nr:sugar ABC transporter ATP-binding protein [Alkalispirochaeta alkalica]
MNFVLQAQGITKSFPGVQALKNVSFSVSPGSVHALVGENGAGKSTLMKIISGALASDEGTLFIDGEERILKNPREAQDLGIAMIHQELTILPLRSVAENIFLGREPRKAGGILLDYAALHTRATDLLNQIHVSVDPSRPAGTLSIAQQQMVEVAKALSLRARVIIMDEPTSSLTSRETSTLFQIIGELQKCGIALIYISHRLEEIFSIADTITILRDGQTVHSAPTADLTPDSVVRYMVGRELKEVFPQGKDSRGDTILRAEHLSGQRFTDVSFSLRSGEILGVAGLVGAGRSEVARALMGLDPLQGGTLLFQGEQIVPRSVRAMMRHGFAFLPEDRKAEGLFLNMSVRDNLAISMLDRVFPFGIIRPRLLLRLIRDYFHRLNIKTPSPLQRIKHLSGGNQQKVIIARCLSLKPRVLILDEPTRGIDIGAKSEIYTIAQDLAAQGVAIIMISSELPEILGISDRILVMREGKSVAILNQGEATQDLIMHKAAGGTSWE